MHDLAGMQLPEEGGEGLSCPFLEVCIYELNSDLKCSFKSILEKKTPTSSPTGPCFCMLYTQCLLEVGPKPSETRNGNDKKEYKNSPNTQCKL